MALNTAHLNGGVLIHSGESILLFCDNVNLEWSGQDDPVFSGKKQGRMYLTTHRMIYNATSDREPMQSFSFPFVALHDVDIEQPVFGANYIKGKVRAQPNGNWTGEAKFKLTFKRGGAIDFGSAMLKAAHLATRQGYNSDLPPSYSPPQGQWYQAPPSAYDFNPTAYYGWIPPTATNAFPDRPPTNSVFMSDAPPPYPGVIGFQPSPQQGGYNPPQQGAYPPQQGGYPPQQGGYPPQQGGYPPQHEGYPVQHGGYPPQDGYAPQQGGYPPQTGGYPPQHGGYPQNGFPPQGAAGFHQSSADAKAAEAAQSAYYDPNRPQMAYVPPPAYYENPPNYYQATDKKTQ